MTVLDVWGGVDPAYGGVGRAAAELAMEVGRSPGWKNQLIAVCRPDEKRIADGIPSSVIRLNSSGTRPMADFNIRRSLRALVESPDMVHVHGLWMPHTLAVRRIADELKKPVVSSVHGMLEKWEIANKGFKKGLYSTLLERSSLRRSACLRALTLREADDYRRYGLKNPVAVIPNGIPPIERTDTVPLFARFPALKDKTIVLYMSRVHYKKGILDLIEAWRDVSRAHPGSHLLVAGPNYEGTLEAACGLVKKYELAPFITFAGTVSGEMKAAALSAARYFCLPSYSEGLSVAVLESLSIGLPVMLTPECNMDDVERVGAGFITSNAPRDLALTISKGLNLDLDSWRALSANAMKLARDRYSWHTIGETMRNVYSWVAGGPRPICVVD